MEGGKWKMEKGKSLVFVSFLQALGVAGYCGLVGLIFSFDSRLFGKVPNLLGIFLMLMLLSASVLICGLLVFGRPVVMWFRGKKEKEAIQLVSYTAGWLVGLVLLVMGIIVGAK